MLANPHPNQTLRCDYPALIFWCINFEFITSPHFELITWSSTEVFWFHQLCGLCLVQKQTRWMAESLVLGFKYAHILQHSMVYVVFLAVFPYSKKEGQKESHAVQRAGAMERIPIGIAGMAWLGRTLIVFWYPCVILAGTPALHARESKLQGLDTNSGR